MIIRIHGGPEGQSRPGFDANLQYWVRELGAAVLLPNVRGSSGYGREYLIGAERAARNVDFSVESLTVKLPGMRTLSRMKDVILRSSVIGTIIGIIPGEGAAVGAFFAYSEA
ncbi:MAG: tripartite tricarboxylate transporter permease, partial [Acidobacteriota bacterium]